METHLGHSTSTEHEKTRNIFFDDPLFEEFALRPLIMDGCPLGEISATASLIEKGVRYNLSNRAGSNSSELRFSLM